MTTKYVLIIMVIIAGVGYVAGRYTTPSKVVTKTVEVIKEVQVIKKDVKTVTKEITRPDGTTEKETTVVDKTNEMSELDSNKQTLSIISNLKPQWKAQGLVGLDHLANPYYGAAIERRVIGPVFGGVWANQNKQYGVTVSVEF